MDRVQTLKDAEYALDRELGIAIHQRGQAYRMGSAGEQDYRTGYADGMERAWLIVGRLVDDEEMATRQ